MHLSGYFASVFIGFSLGLIGGGGSILTVPVLVYLFNVDAALATVYSLFIVGATSAAGSVSYLKNGLVNLRTALVFGVPSIIAVFLTRIYLVPLIPETVLATSAFTLTKNMLLMSLFALLMILASYSMIRRSKSASAGPDGAPAIKYSLVFVQGLAVGVVTGLVGAGGGFLIIPVLVNLLKMPFKTAIGTSLLLIALNSLAGFLFSLFHTSLNWPFLLTVTLIAVIGILLGSYVSTKIDGKKLKPAFGWFVLVVGSYILLKELFIK